MTTSLSEKISWGGGSEFLTQRFLYEHGKHKRNGSFVSFVFKKERETDVSDLSEPFGRRIAPAIR